MLKYSLGQNFQTQPVSIMLQRNIHLFSLPMQGVLPFPELSQETFSVAGDIRLSIRMIQTRDQPKLADCFQSLSIESRYLRFFSAKNTLTPAELRFFTECDGWNHLAIGAFELTVGGAEGALVGIARFIRFQEAGQIAEFSLTVADHWQGLGLGRLLLEQLLVLAAERGIQYLQGYLLAQNKRARRLLSHFEQVNCGSDGELMTVTLTVQNPVGNKPRVVTPGLVPVHWAIPKERQGQKWLH
jgi:GNAT superfamily N-acetyltransferase